MPQFVLLEHTWEGVHWDLMLERDDRLRTWAIDAEPCPGVERPARSLADHRRAYLDYEGPVSGDRGSVRRVDRGDYDVLEWGSDVVRVRLRGAQLVGVAELRRVESDPPGASPAWLFRLGKVD